MEAFLEIGKVANSMNKIGFDLGSDIRLAKDSARGFWDRANRPIEVEYIKLVPKSKFFKA